MYACDYPSLPPIVNSTRLWQYWTWYWNVLRVILMHVISITEVKDKDN